MVQIQNPLTNIKNIYHNAETSPWLLAVQAVPGVGAIAEAIEWFQRGDEVGNAFKSGFPLTERNIQILSRRVLTEMANVTRDIFSLAIFVTLAAMGILGAPSVATAISFVFLFSALTTKLILDGLEGWKAHYWLKTHEKAARPSGRSQREESRRNSPVPVFPGPGYRLGQGLGMRKVGVDLLEEKIASGRASGH
ncbi:MAG: hypothetical protein KGJ02_03170 [Verrucomicrobiota bacterium]|nr:hypothetical protein [Verrucomicrobiota bacterium]